MNALEIIAGIFAFLILVKVLVIVIDKRVWLRFVRRFYVNPIIMSSVCLLLSILVLYYLLQVLSMVQIFAVFAFATLLMGSSAALYSKEIVSFGNKIMKHKITGIEFAQIIIWVLLAVWVLSDLFF